MINSDLADEIDDEPAFACDDAAAMNEAIDRRNAKIARLTARIAELEKALRDVAEAKMPGQARYIARTTLEASGGE